MSPKSEQVLQEFFDQSYVEEMEFEQTEGQMCRVTAHLKGGDQFIFTEEIIWGATLADFFDKLDHFTNGVSYTFVNFDPHEEIERNQEVVNNFYGDY
jgi:hypothetical protein